MQTSELEERRSHARIPVHGRGLSLLQPHNVVSFDVFDISIGGISFTYPGWENWQEKGLKLTYIDFGNLVLDDIPVRVISDVRHDVQTDIDPESPPLRRCGLKFKLLTTIQKDRLSEYLNKISAF